MTFAKLISFQLLTYVLLCHLATSRYELSFTLFCLLIRSFGAPLPPTASLHDHRVVKRSCGWEGGARQKRVNEKSYLKSKDALFSAVWRRDGAEIKRTATSSQSKGTFPRFSRYANFPFLFRSLNFPFISFALCFHHNISYTLSSNLNRTLL